MKRLPSLLLTLFMFTAFRAGAQDNSIVQALDGNNKIWVVVLVLATIFAGIIAFLIYMDLKLRKLEKSSKK